MHNMYGPLVSEENGSQNASVRTYAHRTLPSATAKKIKKRNFITSQIVFKIGETVDKCIYCVSSYLKTRSMLQPVPCEKALAGPVHCFDDGSRSSGEPALAGPSISRVETDDFKVKIWIRCGGLYSGACQCLVVYTRVRRLSYVVHGWTF